MKTAIIALAALNFLAAGSAVASGRVTDVDYMRAARCKGIATGMGQTDTASLDAFLKAEGRSRDPVILDRAAEEMVRAKRETRDLNMKDRLTAELSGVCTAYINTGGSTAVAR